MIHTYDVKYRMRHQWSWRILKDIRGDLIAQDMGGVRVFITDKEERIEIPIEGTVFWFGSGRFLAIKKNMEMEARQPIVTNSAVG